MTDSTITFNPFSIFTPSLPSESTSNSYTAFGETAFTPESVTTTEASVANEPQLTTEAVSNADTTEANEIEYPDNYTEPIDLSFLDVQTINTGRKDDNEEDKKREEDSNAELTTELNVGEEAHRDNVEKQKEIEAEREAKRQEEKLTKEAADFDKDITESINFRKQKEELGQKITKAANALTFGIAPRTYDISNFDSQAYSDAIKEYKKENPNISNKEAISYISKLQDDASTGMLKSGIEYYERTGDTMGIPALETIAKQDANIIQAVELGIMDADEGAKLIEQAHNATTFDQIKAMLTSPSLVGLEANIAAAGAGALAGKLIKPAGKLLAKPASKLYNKLLQSNNKFAQKMVDKIGLSKAMREEAKQQILKEHEAMSNYIENHNSKEIAKWFGRGTDELPYEAQKAFVDDYYRTILKDITTAPASEIDNILQSSLVAATGDLPASAVVKGAAEAIAEAAPAAAPAVAKGAILPAAVAGANKEAAALPTGIPNEKGKQIDTKDIVNDRKNNPYEGEDKVTLRTNEGTVTVSPREAVIISEAEHLTPGMGYTNEVIEAAKGSELIPTKQEEDYGFDFSGADMKAGYYDKEGNYIGEYPAKSFLTKVGDVVQALLGGRDINEDRTISAREWYESTLGKVFKSAGNVVNSIKPKNIKETIDKFGQKLSSNLPGVYDMKTGNVYINQDYEGALPTSPEEAKVKVRNTLEEILPSYSDSNANAAKKSLISQVLGFGESLFNLPGHIISKFVGDYIAGAADEITWLQTGERLDPGQKYAMNLVITNGVMSAFSPVSSVANLVTEAKGLQTGAEIESKFNDTLLLPDDSNHIEFVSNQEDNEEPQAKSGYGTSSDEAYSNSKYSGYVEKAKNSNIATDYNRGMEKEINEAVSDMKVKIFKVYNNEPDYIRNAIGKILKSFKENY
jgi:hypothetical protein